MLVKAEDAVVSLKSNSILFPDCVSLSVFKTLCLSSNDNISCKGVSYGSSRDENKKISAEKKC